VTEKDDDGLLEASREKGMLEGERESWSSETKAEE
jgi:hypothetical protein